MKKINVEFILLLIIYTFIRFKLIESACEINYPASVENSPIYAKALGKYTIYLPYNGKALNLHEGETIQGYCRTNFTSVSYKDTTRPGYYRYNDYEITTLTDQSSITLKCDNGQLRYKNFELRVAVLECNKLNWNVYDTNEGYEWCEKNENEKTFLLATKTSADHHILAGICFNLNEWSLQTITYNVTNSAQKFNKELQRDITKTNMKAFQSLGDELSNLKSNYFDFTDSGLQKELEELSQTNLWLNLANFELSSIVQGASFKNYFNEFSETLSIIWWRNLRLGNWKNFFNTLENYAQNNSFQLYQGTSGAVKIPSKDTMASNILEIKNGYLNRTVPAYIWTYLTSADNKNEDFIIIGYNSPFAEWFGINDIVFCPDICSQIPWLKEITPSFRYATAGVMFCCSPDFVRQTNFLHGFPMDVLLTRSTPKPESILEIEDTSIYMLNSTDLGVTEQSNSVDADDQIITWTEVQLE